MKTVIKKIKNSDAGFVVFFTVLIATIILAITIGITNISLKELNFTATGKESHFALFSADSASECALYNDRNIDFLATLPTTASMTCGGQNISADRTDIITGGYSYVFSNLSLDRGCAIITINKDVQVGATVTDLGTTIEAKGYNVGCTDLTTKNPLRVERVLEYSYLDDATEGTTTGIGTTDGDIIIIGTGTTTGLGTSGGVIMTGTGTTSTTSTTGAGEFITTTGTTATSSTGTGDTQDKVQ